MSNAKLLKIDLMDIRMAADCGILKFYIKDDKIMCTDRISGETVIVGKRKQEGEE